MASIAEGAYDNSGQSCCSVERIYIHSEVYDKFVEAFTNYVKDYKVGDPREPGTQIGPLAREAQLAVLDGSLICVKRD